MDIFFISHGIPTLVIDDTIPARSFLRSWRSSNVIQETPEAIFMVSAHWDTDTPTVNVVHGANDTIYDFYGFPTKMYQLKYPAPGAPDLAQKVKELLNKSGFGPVKEDKAQGLDHGAWVPLLLMYPEANIRLVCQLSVQSAKDGEHHYNIGKALASLRDERVLIIRSGNATHNLHLIGQSGGPIAGWASDFDTWIKDSLIDERYDDVDNFMKKAPNAKQIRARERRRS